MSTFVGTILTPHFFAVATGYPAKLHDIQVGESQNQLLVDRLAREVV